MLVDEKLRRAKVESRNTLETYIYNLKVTYEDALKDKLADDDVKELKRSVEAGLEVRLEMRTCSSCVAERLLLIMHVLGM